MVYFFSRDSKVYFLVQTREELSDFNRKKLKWLFSGAKHIKDNTLEGIFIGPRKEMITPWSTNAVEICQNMGVEGISRIEMVTLTTIENARFDPMLQQIYDGINQDIFHIPEIPEPIRYIADIALYNQQEGLALSPDEVNYLKSVSDKINRKLTDSEVYGFAQINSEHCRHKIFNGTFIINGVAMKDSLFAMIKKTSAINPNSLVSAYKDNVAFILGPKIEQFAPKMNNTAAFFQINDIDTVLSLKAETHNFPTTVEPFNGAATGTGGEIRDRMAGGKGSLPLAGTAVYMTSYTRNNPNRDWEFKVEARPWLYQTPEQILIKASNGASDFGNKFGQPLINGSLLTFEHTENGNTYGYDKVIMQAGGIGFGNQKDAKKEIPEPGDLIVVLGGDNYRIGMGGGAVSSVATGEFGNQIELNAVQRANPEMQKRTMNAIRAMVESDENPIVSIHDHGAGGHLNSLSELVEESGAVINLDKLPVGDPTLSFKEILGNESQERMGLVIKGKDYPFLEAVAKRERAPIYQVGVVKDDQSLVFQSNNNDRPVDLKLEYLFGQPPKTILYDTTENGGFEDITYNIDNIEHYINQVLRLESVACKDWLTNKVDRSVTGKVAMQQTAGCIQLPLNNLGMMALDYQGKTGMATALGHASISGLIDPGAGSRLAIAESLTNLIWAPIVDQLKGVSLSANWMWPAKNPGENARLYQAVEALSDFAIQLGINIPTGKDSLSMTQKYPDGETVFAPGTVIISAAGQVADIKQAIGPVAYPKAGLPLLYINFSRSPMELGGSSFAQTQNKIGKKTPDVKDANYFIKAFNAVQSLISQGSIKSGHDISAGGLVTTLLEMNFANCDHGMEIDLCVFNEQDAVKILFSENPAIVIQVEEREKVCDLLLNQGVDFIEIGQMVGERTLTFIRPDDKKIRLDIDRLRDVWFETSYQLDIKQSGEGFARCRFQNYKRQDLSFSFNKTFTGKAIDFGIDMHRRIATGTKAAIIREKGVNGDREMAYAMYLAGFDVKDVHMTDLIAGREDLSDIHLIVFVGGFSNSDVLGSAKGWAGAFLFNEKAAKSLENFYARKDTLSLGVCNGCQLMTELNLIYPKHPEQVRMLHNESGKFESGFVNLDIAENNSVMLHSLSGNRLGAWIAHGEGKFSFPCFSDNYHIVMKYSYDLYPGNPNGSDWSAAAICSNNGRHLAMMPHLERSFLPWQWPIYPEMHQHDEVSPWMEAFVNARKWIEKWI
ncbi:MAG: phosphoribosylformylglycinamidine synthase [Bacteroidetes bacterium HGW-Bacteroidetes-16]|jgi:phosphoribosylformylglycinamidine synthase|nr:MAG: phosphoribosylformylglycinamidine synthase [Bacteroidetes bacterium HGW-Bacteroidetes-16]